MRDEAMKAYAGRYAGCAWAAGLTGKGYSFRDHSYDIIQMMQRTVVMVSIRCVLPWQRLPIDYICSEYVDLKMVV